ncbi:MAG: hypothetical protein ACK6CE_09750, partial [Planctomycetota bacterium]
IDDFVPSTISRVDFELQFGFPISKLTTLESKLGSIDLFQHPQVQQSVLLGGARFTSLAPTTLGRAPRCWRNAVHAIESEPSEGNQFSRSSGAQ